MSSLGSQLPVEQAVPDSPGPYWTCWRSTSRFWPGHILCVSSLTGLMYTGAIRMVWFMITPQHSNLRRAKRSVFVRREPDTFASRDITARPAYMCQTVHRVESKHRISAFKSQTSRRCVEWYSLQSCVFQRRYAVWKTVEAMAWWNDDDVINIARSRIFFFFCKFIYSLHDR